MATYSPLLKLLFERTGRREKEYSLNAMKSMCAHLGHPERNFRSVHIAGTNGKGSVSLKIAEALKLSGSKVALYTSPHLLTFRERIKINGEMITEEEVATLLEILLEAEALLKLHLSFFELATLLAFLHFSHNKVDWAVIEVGLGGRLDATNVIHPELCVITSIGIDHAEILGTSLEEIAKEKGGILKKHTPVVLGPSVPLSPLLPLLEDTKAPLHQLRGIFSTFDEENSAISREALKLLHCPPSIIDQALLIRPPCRLEVIRAKNHAFEVILDVAHNEAGLKALFLSLDHLYGPKKWPLILGLSSSKDVHNCLAVAIQHASFIYLVAAKSPRAASTKTLTQELDNLSFQNYKACASISEALQNISSPCLIAGTFFIMKEARQSLGLVEPADLLDLNEAYTLQK